MVFGTICDILISIFYEIMVVKFLNGPVWLWSCHDPRLPPSCKMVLETTCDANLPINSHTSWATD